MSRAAYLARYEERTGVIVHWRSRVERHVPYQVEQELWRVLQEALTNVEHHAARDVLRDRLPGHGDHVSLIIEDDGRGFDPAARRRATTTASSECASAPTPSARISSWTATRAGHPSFR